MDTVYRSKRWLVIIVIVGAVLRLGVALYLGDKMEPTPGAYDQIYFHDVALSLLAGKGFSFTDTPWPFIQPGAPTAYVSFLYSLFVAALYFVFGPHPLAVRLVQLVICSLMPLQMYLLVRRILNGAPPPHPSLLPAGERGETVALVAAGITAVYAYFVYYSATLMTEGLYLMAVLASLTLTLDLAAQPTARRWVAWGLVVATASLLRQVFMPMALLLFIYAWARAGRRVKVAHVAAAGAVAAVLILPWTARNYRVYGRFLLLNSQSGQILWNANHPAQGTTFEGDAMFPIPADLRGKNEAELDSELMQRGLQEIAASPGRFVLLSLSRAANLFVFWPRSISGWISNVCRTLSFGLFLPFMVAGLVLSLRRWKKWLLLYLFVVAYVLVHVISWTQIRYRMPVDAVLVPFAAVSLVSLAVWLRGAFAGRRAKALAA